MEFEHIIEPKGGSKISMDSSGKLIVPDNPIVPFIEGDGIGSDITPAMISVVDSAVEKSYGGKKKNGWKYTAARSLQWFMEKIIGFRLKHLEL